MKKVLLPLLGTFALLGPLFASAPAPQGLPPCFCVAGYAITKSVDCPCTLEVMELTWLASPHCAVPGMPNCPSNSDLKCEFYGDVAEFGSCPGSWEDLRIRTRCESAKMAELPCSGGGSHFITLTCNPCMLIQ